jgi:uncharacterized protein
MITDSLFRGSRDECVKFLRDTDGYYVYVLRRQDGRPFYVGKGKGHRCVEHENEARHPNDRKSNIHKLNVIRSIKRSGEKVVYEIDFVSDDELDVYAREAHLIESFGRLHERGPLTNLASGGGSTSGPAPESKERHSATLSGAPDNNLERAILNSFVLSISRMGSVAIKPTDQFTARPTLRYPNKTMSPTLRQAVVIVASAAANGISMDGACHIPRRLNIEDVSGLVENGVACDILTSGLATVIPSENPAEESFDLTATQSRTAVGLVGLRKCVDLGVLSNLDVD